MDSGVSPLHAQALLRHNSTSVSPRNYNRRAKDQIRAIYTHEKYVSSAEMRDFDIYVESDSNMHLIKIPHDIRIHLMQDVYKPDTKRLRIVFPLNRNTFELGLRHR
jgi:hypothetical protein